MDVGTNRMSRAMDEIVGVSSLLDVRARRPIDFPTGNPPPCTNRVENGPNPCVARVTHNLEYFTHTSGWRSANETHPSDIVINRVRSVLLAPYIQQHQIALADWHRTARMRLVMRVFPVGIHPNNRRIISQQTLPRESFHEPLLNLVLLRSPVTHALANFL